MTLEQGVPEQDAAALGELDPRPRWASGVVDRLQLQGGETVLEAGCGDGRATEILLGRLPAGRVLAIDGSARMVELTRRRLAAHSGRLEVMRADAAVAVPGGLYFDAAVSTGAFSRARRQGPLFRNLASVLRPGGRLAAGFTGAGNLERVRRVLRELGHPWDFVPATPEAAIGSLRAAGFRDCAAWLEPCPVRIPSRAQLEAFLRTLVLPVHLARLAEPDRLRLVHQVVLRLPGQEVDFVRLNLNAWRDETDAPCVEDSRW